MWYAFHTVYKHYNNYDIPYIHKSGVDVSWQPTEVTVQEGNNGNMMSTDLCITLEETAGGLQREARFLLSTVTGTAGEPLRKRDYNETFLHKV